MQNFHDDEQKAAPCIKCFEFKLFKSEDLWRTATKSKGPVLNNPGPWATCSQLTKVEFSCATNSKRVTPNQANHVPRFVVCRRPTSLPSNDSERPRNSSLNRKRRTHSRSCFLRANHGSGSCHIPTVTSPTPAARHHLTISLHWFQLGRVSVRMKKSIV